MLNYEDFDEFFLKLYKPIRLLGKGAFGSVWLCQTTEREIAVKVVPRNKFSTAHEDLAIAEAQLMEKLDHENIVKFIRLRETQKFVCCEIELLRGGSLKDRLTERFSESDAACVMKALFSALSYIHAKEIVHRDIKPENILFANSDLASLKLVDFGLSGKLTTDYTLDDQCGTLLFMAPEQAKNKNYSDAVDIWSCGIILYILLTGKHPLYTPGDDRASYFKKLENPAWEYPDGFPALAKDLFQHLVDPNPVNRYTAENALKHPWITRKLDANIPLTYAEQLRMYQTQERMRILTSAVVFMAALNHFSGRVYGPYNSLISEKNERDELKISLTGDTTDESLEHKYSMLNYKTDNPSKIEDPSLIAKEKIHEAELKLHLLSPRRLDKSLKVPHQLPLPVRKTLSSGSLYKESLKKELQVHITSNKVSKTPTARSSITSSPRSTMTNFTAYVKSRLNQS
jgi:serine/threonine protein kinase